MQRMGFGSYRGMMVEKIIGDIKDEILKTSLAGKEKRRKKRRRKKSKDANGHYKLIYAPREPWHAATTRVPPNTVPQISTKSLLFSSFGNGRVLGIT